MSRAPCVEHVKVYSGEIKKTDPPTMDWVCCRCFETGSDAQGPGCPERALYEELIKKAREGSKDAAGLRRDD